jgi:hypothetical protein
MDIVFIDTETTGLNPEIHTVWEVSIITPAEEITYASRPSPEFLSMADPYALSLTKFYARWSRKDVEWESWQRVTAEDMAASVARLTAGKHLVGAVPSFDAAFLDKLLRRNGYAPAWHYHLVDVEALAAGKLGLQPPWDSDELAEKMGVPKLDGKHTALGDARWAKAMYEAVFASGGI